MTRQTAIVLVILAATTTALADESNDLPPIKAIKIKPGQSIFKVASRKEPLVIKSVKDATAHFPKQALAQLQKQVDFEKQIVLVFAWRGSGQDKLSFHILESFPEQVVFKYNPGLTRALGPHVHVYALRANVKWRVKKSAPRIPNRLIRR